jgi:dTMP kinase
MNRGKLITLEGIEGVGKTTHIGFISSLLQKTGHTVVVTREPGGTRAGESIREILLHGKDIKIDALTELLLIFAARAQHLQEVVRPALEAGSYVLCDRFTDASYAYQGGGRGLAQAEIRQLENLVQQGLQPHLTLLFDASVQTGLARANKRGEADRFETETVNFFERVRQAYLDRALDEPARFRVIDAEQPIASVEQQLRRVLETAW